MTAKSQTDTAAQSVRMPSIEELREAIADGWSMGNQLYDDFDEMARLRFESAARAVIALAAQPPAAPVEAFDVLSTIDPNYAESFDRPKCKLCGLEDGACICAHIPPRSEPAAPVARDPQLAALRPDLAPAAPVETEELKKALGEIANRASNLADDDAAEWMPSIYSIACKAIGEDPEPLLKATGFAGEIKDWPTRKPHLPCSADKESPEVSIVPMALADGRTDYFVQIKVGQRAVTPHVFREEYKAAYHVALYDWLLNGHGDEPNCVEFGPNDWPGRVMPDVPQTSSKTGGAE